MPRKTPQKAEQKPSSLKKPTLAKILAEIEASVSSTRGPDGEIRDFYKLDLFGTQTNYIYAFHTGSLVKRLIDSGTEEWYKNIMENPALTKIDEFVRQRLGFDLYPVGGSQYDALDQKNAQYITDVVKGATGYPFFTIQAVQAAISRSVYFSNTTAGTTYWFRKDFSKDFRDKYICMVVDFTANTASDIQGFVVEDKKRGDGKGDKAFMERTKEYLSAYFKNLPIPDEKLIRDPHGEEDDFQEPTISLADMKPTEMVSTKEFESANALIDRRNTATIVAIGAGTSATIATSFLGGSPVMVGGIGVFSIVVLPVLAYALIKRYIRKRLDFWQDSVTEDELAAIEARMARPF